MNVRYNVATQLIETTSSKEYTVLAVDVCSRVEPELKREAAAVLKAAGLDVSTAIRLFLRCVVEKGGLPMDLPRPNATTLAAIKAAMEDKVSDVSLDDL
ncbi:MAG TPA: type II toxin-antitoxin system RelB/DinJ family antitoxin [Rubrivivax sp.]|nr:type II toxin-antitoxin system RelB/DinJ family antitoxin [Rubrivivax sp.]